MANEQKLDISGPYIGTYTASELPGETLHILAIFRQTENVVEGAYYTSSGVYGKGHGILTGNEAKMSWHNIPRSDCPGVYEGIYTFEGDTVTWTYVGVDCAGKEKGAGEATRVEGF